MWIMVQLEYHFVWEGGRERSILRGKCSWFAYLLPSVVHCCGGSGGGEGGCGHTSPTPWSPLLHSGGWSSIIVRKNGLGCMEIQQVEYLQGEMSMLHDLCVLFQTALIFSIMQVSPTGVSQLDDSFKLFPAVVSSLTLTATIPFMFTASNLYCSCVWAMLFYTHT